MYPWGMSCTLAEGRIGGHRCFRYLPDDSQRRTKLLGWVPNLICDPSLTPSGLWPRAALRSTSVPCLCSDGKGGGGIHKCMAETQSRL